MTKRLLSFLPAIGALLVAVPGLACEPELQVAATASVINYDGFDGAQRIEDLPVRVVNNGRTACVGRLLITMPTAPRALVGSGNSQLQFEIIGSGGNAPVLYDPASNRTESLAIRVPPGRSENLPVRLRLPANQRVLAGRYAGTLDFSLEPGPRADNPGQGDPVDWNALNRPVSVAVQVAPRVQANFTAVDAVSGNGRLASVNLGELTSGETRALGIQIRANIDVDISVRSVNGGNLIHSSDGRSQIPYALTVLGTPVDLSQETMLAGQASVSGVTNALLIRIGSIAGARSGSYGDQIVFTISGR
jgi:hypothetical protein